jgi:sigma-B regulation protein RsbU (phosphoserine phosphatase)
MFPMEQYNGLFFTIWYGVYHTGTRRLRFASGGHHPGFLLPRPARAPMALAASNPAIGMIPDFPIKAATIEVPVGSALSLFSDGVFEIIDRDGRQWGLTDVKALLPMACGRGGAGLLYQRVRAASRPGPLDDDFSALLLHFA